MTLNSRKWQKWWKIIRNMLRHLSRPQLWPKRAQGQRERASVANWESHPKRSTTLSILQSIKLRLSLRKLSRRRRREIPRKSWTRAPSRAWLDLMNNSPRNQRPKQLKWLITLPLLRSSPRTRPPLLLSSQKMTPSLIIRRNRSHKQKFQLRSVRMQPLWSMKFKTSTHLSRVWIKRLLLKTKVYLSLQSQKSQAALLLSLIQNQAIKQLWLNQIKQPQLWLNLKMQLLWLNQIKLRQLLASLVRCQL